MKSIVKSKKLTIIAVIIIAIIILVYFVKIKSDGPAIVQNIPQNRIDQTKGFGNPVFLSPTNRGRNQGQQEFYNQYRKDSRGN